MSTKKVGIIRGAMSSEETSKRVASLASKVLRDKNSSAAEKSAAATALTQVPRGGYGAKRKK